MPKLYKTDTMSFGSAQFTRSPFSLLSVVPGMSQQVDSKNLVFDIRKLEPGTYSFPYHYHRNAEELMYIISGEMMMRSPEAFQEVRQGEVIFFEMGETGAHQFYNHTETSCTYLDIKTFLGLDLVVYPDSGKMMVSRYNEVFKFEDQVEYFTDEDNVEEKWGEVFAGKQQGK